MTDHSVIVRSLPQSTYPDYMPGCTPDQAAAMATVALSRVAKAANDLRSVLKEDEAALTNAQIQAANQSADARIGGAAGSAAANVGQVGSDIADITSSIASRNKLAKLHEEYHGVTSGKEGLITKAENRYNRAISQTGISTTPDTVISNSAEAASAQADKDKLTAEYNRKVEDIKSQQKEKASAIDGSKRLFQATSDMTKATGEANAQMLNTAEGSNKQAAKALENAGDVALKLAQGSADLTGRNVVRISG